MSRKSNYEVLRIVAIVLIVAMHAVGCLLGTTNEWNRLGLTAVNAIGNMGVTTFMLISGYFGIHFRWSKLFTLWLITLFYSFIATGADLLLGAEPSAQLVYRALTPVTSLRWWFLSYYLIIFCLSPVLNRLFVVLSQREVEWMLGMLICCFILCPTLLQHPLTGDAEGKGLANLLTAYLVGRYVDRYGCPDWLYFNCGKVLAGCFVVALAGSYVAGCIHPSATIVLCKDNNVLMAMGALAALCWTERHPLSNTAANWLGSFAFPLYLSNWAVLRLLQPYYEGRTGELQIWIFLAAAVVVTLVAAFIIETLRRLLMDRWTRRLGAWVDNHLPCCST